MRCHQHLGNSYGTKNPVSSPDVILEGVRFGFNTPVSSSRTVYQRIGFIAATIMEAYFSWSWKKKTGVLTATMSAISAIVCGCACLATAVAAAPRLLLKFRNRSRAGFSPTSTACIEEQRASVKSKAYTLPGNETKEVTRPPADFHRLHCPFEGLKLWGSVDSIA